MATSVTARVAALREAGYQGPVDALGFADSGDRVADMARNYWAGRNARQEDERQMISLEEWAESAPVDAGVLERGDRVVDHEELENYSPAIGLVVIRQAFWAAADRLKAEAPNMIQASLASLQTSQEVVRTLGLEREEDELAASAEQELADYWGGDDPAYEAIGPDAYTWQADMEAGL